MDGVLVGEEVDDFKSVLDDAGGHQFLSGVAAFSHEAACEALNDGAGCFAEALHLVASGSVGEVSGMIPFAGNVVLYRCCSNWYYYCFEFLSGY